MPGLGIDIGGTSVKACLLDHDRFHQSRSRVYTNPTRDQLVEAVKEAVAGLPGDHGAFIPVGLCLPGRRSAAGDSVDLSVNLPCLNGWIFAELLQSVLGLVPEAWLVTSDVRAAGEDFVCEHRCVARSAIIAIGTGVGLAVFDGKEPVGIGTGGIGHLGMIDMGGLGGADRVGPDGGINTLESYIGARAIEQRFSGCTPEQLGDEIRSMPMDEPMMCALVRAIRIVHAIYVPDRVVLVGGVGIALEPRSGELECAVRDGLTSLARPGWSLMFGDSAFHAARGVARMADQSG